MNKRWVVLFILTALAVKAYIYTADSIETLAKNGLTSKLRVSYIKTNYLTVDGELTILGKLAVYTVTLKPTGCVALVESTAINILPYSGGGKYYVSVPDAATFAACSGIMLRTITLITPTVLATLTVTQRGVTSFAESVSVSVPLYYVYTETIYWTQVLGNQVIASAEYNCSSVIQSYSFDIPSYTVDTRTYNGTSSMLITKAPACPGNLMLVTPTAYLGTPIPLNPQLVLSSIFKKISLETTSTEGGGIPVVGALVFLGALVSALRRRALT